MFAGLSAFPLTPLVEDRVDEPRFASLVTRLAAAGVDSITALGSTGSYAYLDRDERRRVAAAAVEHARETPVIIGIGALRTSHVAALARDAQEVGASAVLLAPVSYQHLTDDDIFSLYQDVCAELSVPLVVYDNPVTTHVAFSLDLYARVARLPQVAAVKIPPVAGDHEAAYARVRAVREAVGPGVAVGISGDGAAVAGLTAGCEAWFSVLAGTLPRPAIAITRAVQAGDHDRAKLESDRLRPLWDLFAQHGSLRVIATVAEHLGMVAAPTLPRPLLGLDGAARAQVTAVVDQLELGD